MNLSIINDPGYRQWLEQLKNQIRQAQVRAAVKVNTELITLYWHLGKEMISKQENSSWGDALVDQLAKDLSNEFPEMKGFSRTNLFYIRRWYLFYSQQVTKVPQLVARIQEVTSGNLESFVPQAVAQIPWGHNREIITKSSDIEEALFYVQETIKNNWSRNVLLAQIESKLYQRQGRSLNNFELTLPKPQADLARETLKNPYNFDFLTLGPAAQERDLEQALTEQVTKFLLELGQGFAYKGKQYHLNVGGDDFYIDLLFYHTTLRCHVVVELKVTEFQPEFAGKLNFYLNAIDQQLKHADDHPSIGILLCKTPNKVVVEYALQNIDKPLGVSEYQYPLTHAIPDDLKGELPSIEELEKELEKEIELPLKPLDRKMKEITELLSGLDGDEVKLERSKELIQKIFEETIPKLEHVASPKVEKFSKLFAKSKITYIVSSQGYYKWEDAVEAFKQNSSVFNIGLNYDFEGFKKAGVNAFSSSSKIDIKLRDFSYVLETEREKPIIKKMYHEELVESEMEEIVDQMLLKVAEQIESELQRIKK